MTTGAPAGDVTLSRAQALIELSRDEDAAGLLTRLVAAEPGNGRAWTLLAQCHLSAGRHDAAVRAATEAVRLLPDSDWALRVLALAQAGAGRHAEALRAAEEALRLEPMSWRCHTCLAQVLTKSSSGLARAEHEARKAIELAPLEPETHFTLGLVGLSHQDNGVAEAAFRRVLELDPQHSAARNNLGVVALRQRRTSQAVGHFRGALASSPAHQLAARNLETVLQAMVRRMAWLMLVGIFVVGRLTAVLGDHRSGGDSGSLRLVAAGMFAVCGALMLFSYLRLPRDVQRAVVSLTRRPGPSRRRVTLLLIALAALLVAAVSPFYGVSSAAAALAGICVLIARFGGRVRVPWRRRG